MKQSKQEWSRRRFIATLGGTGAVMMLHPLWSWTIDPTDPGVAVIVAKTIGIDTHGHIDVPLDKAELPGPKLNLSEEMKKSGLSAIVTTFATDYKRNVQPGEAYERFINGITAMDNVLADNNMKRALTLADVQDAHKLHQPIAIQSVEGCHFLEGNPDRVNMAYSRGLRHLGLLHDSDASVPLGDVYTNPAKFQGLTSFGSDVIKECNRLGILIDLAHAGNDTINAALKLTTKPVIISHTGLDTQLGQNASTAKMMRPRLISKEQAKIVADAGGVVSVWTHLSDTPLEFAQNIKALVNVMGIEHVGIGTDTKLTPPYSSPNESFGSKPGGDGPKPGGDNPGIKQDGPPRDSNGPNGGPGRNKGGRPGERTNEAWTYQKAGFYYAVVDAMLKTGFTENDIAKIGGGNYCRVFDAATAGH